MTKEDCACNSDDESSIDSNSTCESYIKREHLKQCKNCRKKEHLKRCEKCRKKEHLKKCDSCRTKAQPKICSTDCKPSVPVVPLCQNDKEYTDGKYIVIKIKQM